FFFFSSRRRHTRFSRDWSSDVCSSDLQRMDAAEEGGRAPGNRVSHDLEGGGPVDQTGHDHRKPVVWIAVVPPVLSDPGSLLIKFAVDVAEPIALEDGDLGPWLREPLVPSLPDSVSLADERKQPISMRLESSHSLLPANAFFQ